MRDKRSAKLRWGTHFILLIFFGIGSLLDARLVNKWTFGWFVGRYDMDKLLHKHYDWFVVVVVKNDVMCIDSIAFDSHFNKYEQIFFASRAFLRRVHVP